jgi:hypothetical protein
MKPRVILCLAKYAAVTGRGWRIFAAPRAPLHVFITASDPWRGDTKYLADCHPWRYINYGHRRSQIGINIYARCSFLSYKHCFFPTSPSVYFLHAIDHTLDARHSSIISLFHQTTLENFHTFNDNDVLPTTISQWPSQLSKSSPPDANALAT